MTCLRALYLLPAEGFGGAERQGVLHIANLRRAGVDVLAVTGPGKPVQTELSRADVRDYVCYSGFPGAEIEAPGWRSSFARPWRYGQAWWRATRDITALARARKIDVIFACRAFGWIVGSFVGRRLGVPVVWRAGSMPTSGIQRFMLRHLARVIAPALVVANSERGRRTYAGLLRVPSAVLPNGVDTHRFSPATAPRLRHELGLQETPVIGLAARPAPGKGLDFLAEVALGVLGRHPSTHFLIAGEFPWRQHYEELFAKLGLAKNVTFLGHIAEIETFYASCDVVVLTSRPDSIEMSSNAIIEAMAVGRAVVATDVGGTSEIVKDGSNGSLIPPENSALFAEALIRLLEDINLRLQFGTAARGRVLRDHSAEAVTENLKRVLQRAIVTAAAGGNADHQASDHLGALWDPSTNPEGAGGLTSREAGEGGLTLHLPHANKASDNPR